MGWMKDPDWAGGHEGWIGMVLDDGTITGAWTVETGPRVVGWRAACECGWRANDLYTRDQHPSSDGYVPDHLEDECLALWDGHMDDILADRWERTTAELARTLRWLGDQADIIHKPSTQIDNIACAAAHAHELAETLRLSSHMAGR